MRADIIAAYKRQQGMAEGKNNIDNKIIHLLTNGIPADAIARKLDIPVEWVHEVAKYNMPDSDIDYNDPRNSTQGRERFGEQGVAESQTDYQKRRQRDRDVDAGRPVTRQPKNPQTDYARKRAKDRKDMELGETTNYWTRLQNERNTKIARLVGELTESVKDIK
jgi:hypothetical protein